MTLQASGAISLGNVNTEVGTNSANETRSLGDSITRGLFGVASGAISLSNGYSRTHTPDFEIIPSVNGRSTWTIAINGALNLGSHGQWNLKPKKNFTASVKMWGAGGARGYGYNQVPLGNYSQTNGGGGGYTSGSITFYTNQVNYYLRVGEGGSRVSGTSGQRADYRAGGVPTSNGGAEGGGYSGIFSGGFYQGAAYVRLMAGGGGGGGDARYGGGGGAGGGSAGETSDAAYPQGGGGGGPNAGGYAAQYNGAGAGSGLTGGWGSNPSHPSLGGGGGGYWGGGGGNVGGGGGGSGYVGAVAYGVNSGTTTAGVSATPANSSDSQRGGAGDGGSSSQGSNGADGRIILS